MKIDNGSVYSPEGNRRSCRRWCITREIENKLHVPLQQGTGAVSSSKSPFEENCDNLESNSCYADQNYVYMIII